MANFLEALLAQNGLGPPEAGTGAPIIPPPQLDEEPQEATVAAQRPYDRSGMFGVRGTLRDILGTLGDAFLAQGGGRTVYQPRRQMEREGDAQKGFTTDPMGAIARLNRENPAAAREFFDDQQTQDRQATTARQRHEDTTVDRTLRLFAGVNARSWPQLREQALRYAASRGVTLPFDIPEKYDEEAVNRLRQFGVPVPAQIDDESQVAYRAGIDEDRDASREGMEAYRQRQIEIRREQLRQQGRLGEARIGVQREAEVGRNTRHNNPVARPRAGSGRPSNIVRRPDPSKPGGFALGRRNADGTVTPLN